MKRIWHEITYNSWSAIKLHNTFLYRRYNSYNCVHIDPLISNLNVPIFCLSFSWWVVGRNTTQSSMCNLCMRASRENSTHVTGWSTARHFLSGQLLHVCFVRVEMILIRSLAPTNEKIFFFFFFFFFFWCVFYLFECFHFECPINRFLFIFTLYIV